MKKKIVIIAAAALAVIAAAGAAVMLLLPGLKQATAEDILRNTASGIFGALPEFETDKAPEADSLTELSAAVTIPAKFAGTENDILFTAGIIGDCDGKSGSVHLHAGSGKYKIFALSELYGGRFDTRFRVSGASGSPASFTTGFEIKGCADACDKSWFNPAVNPDSPLDGDTYAAVRDVLVEFEEKYSRMLSGEDTADEASETAEKLEALKEKLSALQKTETVKDGKLFGKTEITIESSMGPEEITEALRLIYDYISDEAPESWLDAAGSLAGAQGTGAGEESTAAFDFENTLDELYKAIEKSGVNVKTVVKISENRIDSVEITVSCKAYPEEAGTEAISSEFSLLSAESVTGATETSLKLVVSFDYETKKITCECGITENGEEKAELNASVNAENSGSSLKIKFEAGGSASGDDLGSVSFEAKYESDGTVLRLSFDGSAEASYFETQHISLALSYEKSGEWTLKTDGRDFASGTFMTSETSVDFTVDSILLPYTDVYFLYGEGLYNESETLTAENFISFHADSEEVKSAQSLDGTDLFSLTEKEIEELSEDGGIIYEALSAIQSVTSYVMPYTAKTSDGITVKPKDKTENRANQILTAYQNYVNKTLGPNAFTLDSAYVWLFDDISKLYYVIDASSGTANVYIFTQVSEDITTLYHAASVSESSMTIHSFIGETPDIACGEQIYTLYTCSRCGFQVASYTGKTKEHSYTEKQSTMKSAENPGKSVSVTVKECSACGGLIVTVPSEYYTVSYSVNGEGYTAESVTFDSTSLHPRVVAVTLPDGYSGKITAVADGFIHDDYNRSVYGIYIPEGVKTIGANAFADAANLRNVLLPATLQSIGDGAFSGCRNLNKIFFCGSAKSWLTSVDLGDGAALISSVGVFCDSTPSAEFMSKNDLTLTNYQKVNKNMTTVRTKSITSAQSLLGQASGVYYAKLRNSQFSNANEKMIFFVGADDKTGSVAVANWQGEVSVYSASGKYLGNIPQMYNGLSGGEGYIISSSYGWVAAYDALTLKEIIKAEPDSNSFGNEYRSPVVYNGVIYAMSSKGLISVKISDGSVKLLKNINKGNYYTIIPDRNKGLLYIACQVTPNDGKVYILHPDTGVIEAFASEYQFYNSFDGECICYTMLQDNYKIGYKLKPDYTYNEVNIGTLYTSFRFGPAGTDSATGVTAYGTRIISASILNAVDGYTPYRFMYKDETSQVYVGYNSSFNVCTVVGYNGKTKVLPFVADSVVTYGPGRFILWSEKATEAVIIDMTQ